MKISLTIRLAFLAAVVAVSASTRQVFGGHPVWPPRKHSAEYRQANMLFLHFQDALAAERWQEALALCSDRVRAKAADWPSPKAFLTGTIPTELLLAQDFGFWTFRSDRPGGFDGADRASFYALIVTLTEPESTTVVQWHWAIYATNQTWVVDYPPVKLEEYIARKKAAIQVRDENINRLRQSLESKVQGIETHLIPVSERFSIGSPMLFRVELTNSGKTAMDYMDSGVAHAPLTVLNDKGRPLHYSENPVQIMVRKGEVAPGTSVVLAESIDLNQNYAITEPGKYEVQFSGKSLQMGQPLLNRSPDLWGEDDKAIRASFDFFAVTNRFPSDFIKIEVIAGQKQ